MNIPLLPPNTPSRLHLLLLSYYENRWNIIIIYNIMAFFPWGIRNRKHCKYISILNTIYAIIETSVFTDLGFITETSTYVLAKINSHFIMKKDDLCIYDAEGKICNSHLQVSHSLSIALFSQCPPSALK